ncbi:putative glucan endo-1,3-beta-D-glucosidase [Dioscorea sansibarensis]
MHPKLCSSISLKMHPSLLALFLLLLCTSPEFTTSSTTFTFVNKCHYTVWPGILSGSSSPPLASTGFELASGASRSFQAPIGWSGRFWARTGCSFDDSGKFSCTTGDCHSGQVECNGAGATPPATLAEFTLTGPSAVKDFYDVSLVDGYNLPMIVESHGGSGDCATTGCVVDLNQRCPAELKAAGGDACNSACEAFAKPEFCCSDAYSSPATCKPSNYSLIFKSACPKSYSYAYDDATSTFTCLNGDYTITFCPVFTLPRIKLFFRGSSNLTELISENESWLAIAAAMGDANTLTSDPLLGFGFYMVLITSCFILKFL